MKVFVKTAFDTRAVELLAERASKSALKSAGAFVRKTAINSIRQTKAKPAPKGQPPHTRHGRLKKAVLFAVDAAATSVVVGPAANLISSVGHFHEFGGTETKAAKPKQYRVGGVGPVRIAKDGHPVFARLKNFRMVQVAQRLDRQLTDGKQTIRQYPRRPFMGPALERTVPKLPDFWRNSVKG